MPFLSITATPGEEYLSISGSDVPITQAQPITEAGTFGDRPRIVVFQREVPEPALILDRLQTTLASSRVPATADAFDCPVTVAIRAIENAVAEVWPPNRLKCPECQHYFVAPIAEARRMYLACPHCHNPVLNPRWSSG